MTPLGREIAETIAAEGPMPVDRYMALSLSHPLHGYYATRDPFGRGGDFVTAPEISQMFGEVLGLWAAETWRLMGAPERFLLIELGPGRGAMMADMLRAAKAAPGFVEAARITLVETSPALRDIQTKALGGRDVRWVATVAEALAPDLEPPPHPHPYPLPQGEREAGPSRPVIERGAAASFPSPLVGEGGRDSGRMRGRLGHAPPLAAIIVANEFFDALPIRQFVRTDRGWRERLVGLDDAGALAFGLSPEPPDLALPDAPEGSTREVAARSIEIVARVARHLSAHGGAMLAIDYGYGSGFGDTLQAVKAHAFADPLAAPGEADLTAHVDFGALAAAAQANGARPMRLVDQADLLERLGLLARAAALSNAAPQRSAEIVSAARRLTDRGPRGMGALFKALAVCDPRLGPPPAFEPIPGADR